MADRRQLAQGLMMMTPAMREDLAGREQDIQRGKTVELLRRAGKEMYDNPIVNSAIGFTPILGDVQAAGETMAALNRGAPWQETAGYAAGMLPFVPMIGKTVWHGSPHSFEKFDLSKIGTGEGAQAYGHGLYLADAPETAKSYSGKLSSELSYNGKPMNRESGRNTKDSAAWALYLAEGDKEAAKASGLAKPELIEKLDYSKIQPGGQLYKVDLPDEQIAKMLDWDKPLSEQPNIQKALLNQDNGWKSYASQLNPEMRSIAEDMVIGAKPVHGDDATGLWNALMEKYPLLDHNEIHDTRWRINPEYSDSDWLHSVLSGNGAIGSGVRGGGGADLYNSMGGGAEASNRLLELGIPGIKYLDQASRGAGEGTSNYVVFSDEIPQILERNNIPVNK